MKKIPEKFETLERLTFNFRYDCAILFCISIENIYQIIFVEA